MALRVRRTVPPFDEQDIGFTPAGDLDEAAISTFGGSDPLVVSRWYDQSGQSNHAVQISPGAQPQIYNGTAVITENGKPCMNFDGSNDHLELTNLGSVSAVSCFQVAKTIQTQTGAVLHCTSNLNTMHQPLGTDLYDNLGTTGRTGAIAVSTDMESQYLYSTSSTGTKTIRLNGSQIHQSSATVGIGTAPHYIGVGYYTVIDFYKGVIQEVIIYASDESSNFTGIETNIMTYYGIP